MDKYEFFLKITLCKWKFVFRKFENHQISWFVNSFRKVTDYKINSQNIVHFMIFINKQKNALKKNVFFKSSNKIQIFSESDKRPVYMEL